MMNTNLAIIINKVANGWIVTMPVPVETWRKFEDSNTRRQIVIQKEAMEESEVEKLKNAGDEGSDQKADLKIGKVDELQNIFVFTEWSKVLDFLADKVDA